MCEDEMSFEQRNLGKLNPTQKKKKKTDQIPPIWKMQNLFKNFTREETNMSNKLQTELAQSRWG